MIGRLLQILKASEESPDATELADALWLASHMPQRRPRPRSDAATQPATRPMPGTTASPDPRSPQIPLAGLHLTEPEKAAESGALAGQAADIAGTLAGVPAIPAIPAVADIMRALRPLRTRVDGKTRGIIDEDATARNIADSGLWLPELLPDPERWLDLQLIVDDSSSMRIWRRTVAEFRALLVQLAAFRDIRTVTINTDEDTVIPLTRASAGRRLVLATTSPVDLVTPFRQAVRHLADVPLDPGERIRDDHVGDPQARPAELRLRPQRAPAEEPEPVRRLPTATAREDDDPCTRSGQRCSAVGPPPERSVVLADVTLVGCLEVGLPGDRIPAGPGADVGRGHVGAECHPPTVVGGPALPVALLGVEEELLVEPTDVRERPVPQEQDRTDQEVDPVA